MIDVGALEQDLKEIHNAQALLGKRMIGLICELAQEVATLQSDVQDLEYKISDLENDK